MREIAQMNFKNSTIRDTLKIQIGWKQKDRKRHSMQIISKKIARVTTQMALNLWWFDLCYFSFRKIGNHAHKSFWFSLSRQHLVNLYDISRTLLLNRICITWFCSSVC
jgi:hypothetical protein